MEDKLHAQGVAPLCGVDEAGRGPLAGPVVAAAVIFPPDSELRLLVRDSKSLSPGRRLSLYTRLVSSPGVAWSVAVKDARFIDEVNILNATLAAMKEAVMGLPTSPACVLVDGNVKPDVACTCHAVVRGDTTEPSVMAASIIAKVTRDRIMEDMDALYPGYGFSRHKGYPTAEHRAAIVRLGPCAIHRRSFRGVS